jgi:V/A-type H+-transporting ATPase subunit C
MGKLKMYNKDDYLFIASRIRVMENKLLTKQDYEAMLISESLTEIYRILEEHGIKGKESSFGERDYEQALSDMLISSYGEILGSVPNPELFSILTYPYDCNNLKAVLKGTESGVPYEHALVPLGTVSLERVKENVKNRDFSEFPENMREAAREAILLLAKTKMPQTAELLLDSACFADIQAAVNENPVPLFSELLKIKADTVNILSSLRICKLFSGEKAADIMEKTFVSGGSLPIDIFIGVIEAGALENGQTTGVDDESGLIKNEEDKFLEKVETALAERLVYTEYSNFGKRLFSGGISVYEAEKILDDIYIKKAKSSREVLSGAEVIAGYLLAIENQVKNIRIILAGKKHKADYKSLSERLRESYV